MKSNELIRLLKQDGWFPINQKGSHIRFIHSTKKGVVFAPNHGSKEVGKGLELKILKQAGIN